ERAAVSLDPAAPAPTDALIAAVAKAGYGARPLAPVGSAAADEAGLAAEEDEQDRCNRAELRRKLVTLALGVVLTVPVLSIAMFAMDLRYRDYVLLALTTPVWLVVGWEFHRGALRAAGHLTANMDTLVSAGATVAFVYSVAATFSGRDTFYDTAAVIITLIFLGKVLETVA